jgi:hypothetical protein
MAVFTGAREVSGWEAVGRAAGGAWRITNVKVNMSSSSLFNLRRKSGGPPGTAGSGSCTNSTGALSPSGLTTDSLVAGNAFGVTVRDVRLRGFVTTKEDMVKRFWSLRYRAAPSSGLLLMFPMARKGGSTADRNWEERAVAKDGGRGKTARTRCPREWTKDEGWRGSGRVQHCHFQVGATFRVVPVERLICPKRMQSIARIASTGAPSAQAYDDCCGEQEKQREERK